MRNDFYPQGTVQVLLKTHLVSLNTFAVLQNRLDAKPVTEPRLFDKKIFITLQAVCARLIPQPDKSRMVDLAGCLDSNLSEGKGNGWRYDSLPGDNELFIIGLYGIDKTALAVFGNRFHTLPESEQDEVLTSIQSATATEFTWQIIPANLFFEELLSALVEIYYSHPFAKEEIGEMAMTDVPGWKKIGLNELEEREPLSLIHVADQK